MKLPKKYKLCRRLGTGVYEKCQNPKLRSLLLKMMTISISFGLVYLLYISFGFLLIKYVGKLYARKLIEEYYEN
jgi:hypothetical protein